MAEHSTDWFRVGERLRWIRKKTGLNQRKFGRLFGVSQNMISLYERGKSRASVEFYLRVARVGNQTLEWLLTGGDDRTLDTLREMRDLHEKMSSHLGIVRNLLNRETKTAREQKILATDDPAQLREILLGVEDLPRCFREILGDAAAWDALAMTGREVIALCDLVETFGEIRPEGVHLFLRLVRKNTYTVDRNGIVAAMPAVASATVKETATPPPN